MKLSYRIRLKGTDNWATIDKEVFNGLSLEDGARMPEIQGSKVIITNYFNMFWGRIMGARNFRVFLVLSQFAYGNKDYSYPSLQTLSDICDMSVNTVKAAVKALEELGFVLQVQVYNEDKEENENNIYILRKTTPFLSVEQFQSLPRKLQDLHKKYIQGIEESERITLSNAPDYPSPAKGASKPDRGGSKIDRPLKKVETVGNGGNVGITVEKGGSNIDAPQSIADTSQYLMEGQSEFDGGVGQNLTPNKYNPLSTTNPNQLKNITIIQDEFYEILRNKLSRPSFDTWVKTLTISGFDTSRNILTIRAVNQMQKEWVESRYLPLFHSTFAEHFKCPDVKINVTMAPDRVL